MTNLQIISEACCSLLKENYPASQSVQNYLNTRLDKRTQEIFKFGYFPNIEHINSLISIIGKDILEKEKLLFSKDIEDSLYSRSVNFSYFEDYPVLIPFHNPYGEVVGLVGRTLLNDQQRAEKSIPKYKNNIGFKKTLNLFGLYENKQHILDKQCVYIVEGQFDVIKATEKGFNNIVAIGSNNMSGYQFSIITRYTNNIFLLLDNDEAGEKGRKRILQKFSKYAFIKDVYLPQEYKDIDEFFSTHNLEDLELRMKL